MKTASFDTWTSLFLVVAAMGIFLAVLLFTNKAGRKSNFEISLLLFGFSVVLIQYVFFWTNYQSVYPAVHFYDNAWYLLFGPLFYGYLKRWQSKGSKLGIYHYLPALIALSLSVVYIFKTAAFTDYSTVKEQYAFYFFQIFRSPWIGIISLFFYQFLIWDLHRDRQEDRETQGFKVQLRWTTALSRLYTVFIIAYLSYYLLVRLDFFNDYWDYGISITMSLAIYTIGYFVFKEPAIFNGELLRSVFVDSEKRQSKETDADAITKSQHFNALKAHIEENQSYLNPDLRLTHLADELNLPLHELSQIINKTGKTNFNKLINDFRLQAAVELLVNNGGDSIKSIFYKVGFNSKSAFYKAFKRKFDCTPQAYRVNFYKKK